jgi:hypothetical protein
MSNYLNVSFASNDDYPKKWLSDGTKRMTPIHFQSMKEDVVFINNAKGYLIYTVPVSILTFIFLRKIYWKMKRFRILILIRTFSSWSYLFVSLIGDNSIYISFRCFQQLHYGIYRVFSKNVLFLLSTVLALVTLFVLILIAVGVYTLSWEMALKTF